MLREIGTRTGGELDRVNFGSSYPGGGLKADEGLATELRGSQEGEGG